jgi:ATP-dependent RNA helicase DeaD
LFIGNELVIFDIISFDVMSHNIRYVVRWILLGEKKMLFEELPLRQELHKAVVQLGFKEPTEIQEKCIPIILSGKDIVGQSQTGSGKTAAFGLPILNYVSTGNGVQALILTPTRELCVQVYNTMKDLGRYMRVRITSIYGGVSMGPQVDELRHADVVVGTPGRILDHINRRSLDLSKVRFFVLDEADKMLEMGFIEDVTKILKYTQRDRQSLMFSATMPSQIKRIVEHYFNHPVFVSGQRHVDTKLLRQAYYNIEPNQKFPLLVHLLKKGKDGVALVFCATRHEVDLVNNNLSKQGINAVAIHGGLSQNRRLHVVDLIRKDNVNVLVATDVAARGLDLRNITHVYNYDLPKSAEEYTHRIGRTARAGDSGNAITLLTHADYSRFSSILSDRTIKIIREQPPEFEMIRFERSRMQESGDRPQGYARHTPRGGFSSRQGFSKRTTGSSPRQEYSGTDSGDRHGSSSRQPPRFRQNTSRRHTR